jgi:hypothetical protein
LVAAGSCACSVPLAGRRYRAGDRLFITFSAPGRRPERAEVIIRNGKLPRVRLLRS